MLVIAPRSFADNADRLLIDFDTTLTASDTPVVALVMTVFIAAVRTVAALDTAVVAVASAALTVFMAVVVAVAIA